MSQAITAIIGGNTMATEWDRTGEVLTLAPYCWGQGNGVANQNAGNFPTVGGKGQPAVLSDMTANYGYRYVADDSHLLFDSASPSDEVQTAYQRAFTDANQFTIEAKGNVINAGTHRYICGARDGANDFWELRIHSTNKLQFLVRSGGVDKTTRGTDTVSLTLHTFHVTKDGATFRLFIDGVEVVAYDSQEAYNFGNKTLTNGVYVGNYGAAANVFKKELYWFCIYDRLLSDAEILSNHQIGIGMNGLIGTNTGDNMALEYPASFIGEDRARSRGRTR